MRLYGDISQRTEPRASAGGRNSLEEAPPAPLWSRLCTLIVSIDITYRASGLAEGHRVREAG